MATSTSAAEQFQASSVAQVDISPDQRMALLAQAFEMELAGTDEGSDGAAWPMGKTIWFAAGISLVLWIAILSALRFI